jgi:hypothetical protein
MLEVLVLELEEVVVTLDLILETRVHLQILETLVKVVKRVF